MWPTVRLKPADLFRKIGDNVMEEFNQKEMVLTREQKAALFLEAQLLIKLCQEARAHKEHDKEKLCYPIQVSRVGKPLC
jgi:hypothetical protein